MFKALNELIAQLQKLPGVGAKTATRYAYFLVEQPLEQSLNLAHAIEAAAANVTPCQKCNMLTDSGLCDFCADERRQNRQLCLIQHTMDAYLIEKAGVFKGRYFVLGKLLSPLDGIGPEQLPLQRLAKLIKEENISELILALNPSAEGETTMHYLSEELAATGVAITRLATGLPFGADMEFTSAPTLAHAFSRRYSF